MNDAERKEYARRLLDNPLLTEILASMTEAAIASAVRAGPAESLEVVAQFKAVDDFKTKIMQHFSNADISQHNADQRKRIV